MRRLLALPLGAPRVTMAVMLALTIIFGFFARSIRVEGSIETLLPANDPDRQYFEDAKAVFGDADVAVIGVFTPDVFAPATVAKIDALSTRIAAIEGVHDVISLTTVKGIELNDFGLSAGRLMHEVPRTSEEAAAFRGRVLANPLYLKNIVSADGRAAGISIVLDSMSDEDVQRRGIVDKLRALIAEFEGPEHLALGGTPVIKAAAARYLETDVFKFAPLSLVVIAGILACGWRTVRAILVPLTTVLVGVVWTTGLMALAGGAIHLGTLGMPALLTLLGIATGIHMITQYERELQPGRTPAEVVGRTIENVRVPIGITAVTTLIAFGALSFTPIRAIHQFGVYSVVGILVILLAAFILVPSVLMVLDLPKTGVHVAAEGYGWLPRSLRAISAVAVHHRRGVLLGSLGAVALCCAGMWRIQSTADYVSLFSPGAPIRADNTLISNGLAGTQPIYLVIDGSGPQAVSRLDALAAISELQAFVNQQPGIDTSLSLVDYLRLVRHVLQPDAPTPLPEAQNEVDQILLLVDPADVRAVVNSDASRANIIVRTSLSRSSDIRAFLERVRAFAAQHLPHGLTLRPTGSAVVLSDAADVLSWGLFTRLWHALAVLVVLLSILFLSVRVGLLAIVPIVFPTIVLFGIMGWVGIQLNASTSMIASIAIAIAIDDTLHLLNSFNRELRKTGNQEVAAINAVGSVGPSACWIAISLSAGFLIVCLSHFEPLRHLGLLLAITMGVALAVDLFLTPALVTTTEIITLWDLLFLKLGPAPHEQIPLLQGLRPWRAKLVVLMGRLEAVPSGTYITRRGEVKPELYVLLSGRVEVHRGEDDRIIRYLGRGDVVGEMGLVRQRPRSADVVAADDTEYLVLDGCFLQRLRRQYPRIASTVFLNLTRILSDRLESTTDALAAQPAEPKTSASAARS